MRHLRLDEHMAEFRHEFDVPDEIRARIADLSCVFNERVVPNALKRRYYEGHIRLDEVNLGLALPKGMRELEISCAWGEKAVDVLAARSMFDGFVGLDGEPSAAMAEISRANRLIAEYSKATRNELIYGCDFATLSADSGIGCRVRFHSPETAAARWNDELGRIDCGLAVIDVCREFGYWKPSAVAYYDDEATWILRRAARGRWEAERVPHKLGRPLMEPLVWNATSAKPFGRSRLKKPIRNLIDGYVRTMANATIGLEFATAPQKYLLGVTDDQYDAVLSDKFVAYVGSILAATNNPDTGEKPTFGQLPQGTLEPHIAMLRALATQFSAASGLTVTDVGVINDANPTSSDAILAQSRTLVLMAEQLNTSNGDALYAISQMAQALARGVRLDELTEEERGVMAHFKNPSMPSVSVTADAALKIATARPAFAGTDVFTEMLGFDRADIRRIKAQELRARGLAVLEELEAE